MTAEKEFLKLPSDVRALIQFLEEDDRAAAVVELDFQATANIKESYQNGAFRQLGQCARLENLVNELGCAHRKSAASYTARADGRRWRCKEVSPSWVALTCVQDDGPCQEHRGSGAREEQASANPGSLRDISDGNKERKPDRRAEGETGSSNKPSDDAQPQILDWTRFDVSGLPPYIEFI